MSLGAWGLRSEGETVTGKPGPVYEPLMRLVGLTGRPSDRSPVMTVARSVGDVLTEHVVFEVDCIDRMYCNVYVPGLQYAAGLVLRVIDLAHGGVVPVEAGSGVN